MASEKTAVIEHLFDSNWDPEKKTLRKTLMSLDDVSHAIRYCNGIDSKKRSDKNPANFLKDVVRSRNASNIWPAKITALGYTGEQRTGAGDSFEFIRIPPGQTEPFPDLFRATDRTKLINTQSVSMSLASKELGRADEAWLVQTAVNLRIVEQHMATISALKAQEITHLQMTVKLRATEIDAIYLARFPALGKTLITCEAKSGKERILINQIINQVRATFETTDAETVVPMAIRSEKGLGIHAIEFAPIKRSEAENIFELEFASDAMYRLLPPVKGIC